MLSLLPQDGSTEVNCTISYLHLLLLCCVCACLHLCLMAKLRFIYSVRSVLWCKWCEVNLDYEVTLGHAPNKYNCVGARKICFWNRPAGLLHLYTYVFRL